MEKFEDQLPFTFKYKLDDYDLQTYFDLDELLDIIKTQNKKSIILQFPVFQMSDAIKVQNYLQGKVEDPETKFYILSDHLKQPCCVDVVGAGHLNYDFIVHFGQACFSELYHEKVHYILPKVKIDVKAADSALREYFSKNKETQTFVLFDQEFNHAQKEFLGLNEIENCNLGILNDLKNFKNENKLFFGYYASKSFDCKQDKIGTEEDQEQVEEQKISEKNLILVSSSGETSKTIEKIFFLKDKYNIQDVYLCDGESVQSLNFRLNKYIMKRIHLIEQAKEINVFGVLVSNPNTKFCQNVLARTRHVIRSNKKKLFTFVMNNMNEAKLNNFPEVEAYVIISCHNNSLFEYKDFHKLIITPFELELAVNDIGFSAYFQMDGSNIDDFVVPKKQCGEKCGEDKDCGQESCKCKNTKEKEEEEKEQEEEEEKKEQEVQQQQEGEQEEEEGEGGYTEADFEEQQIALKEAKYYQIASTKIFQTLDFYKNRLYQGLDIKLEKDVTLAKQGLTGIAQQYEHEKDAHEQN